MATDLAQPEIAPGQSAVVRAVRRGNPWPARGILLLALLIAGFAVVRLALDLQPIPELSQVERLLGQGKTSEAERVLKTILARSPENGDARMRLARLLASRGDRLACAETLHEVPWWWPTKRKALFLEGQTFHECKLARRAEAAWRACVRDDPLHPAEPGLVKNAAQSLVGYFLVQGRLDDARQVLWDAYAQASSEEQPAVLGTRLRVELERIDPKESVGVLRDYLAADPADHESRRALALAYQLNGDAVTSDRLIQECLRSRPKDPRVWQTWLAILQDRNDAAGLSRALTALPRGIGQDLEILKAKAADFESNGRLEDAAGALRDALKVDDFDEEAHFRLARVLQRLDQPEQAARHRARYQELSKARDALPKALAEYGELSREATTDDKLRASIERLAELSEQLGWGRLAREWRKQVP